MNAKVAKPDPIVIKRASKGHQPANPEHRTNRPGQPLPAIARNPDCTHTVPGELFEFGYSTIVDLFKLSLVVDHVSHFIVAWEVERTGDPTTSADVERMVESSFQPRTDTLTGAKRIGGGACNELVVTTDSPIGGVSRDRRFRSYSGITQAGCNTASVESALQRVGLETKVIMTEPASFEPRAIQEVRSVALRLAPQIRFFALAVAHGVWRANYELTPGFTTSAFDRLIAPSE